MGSYNERLKQSVGVKAENATTVKNFLQAVMGLEGDKQLTVGALLAVIETQRVEKERYVNALQIIFNTLAELYVETLTEEELVAMVYDPEVIDYFGDPYMDSDEPQDPLTRDDQIELGRQSFPYIGIQLWLDLSED